MASTIDAAAARSGRIDLARTPGFALGALRVDPPAREVSGPQGRATVEPRVLQVLIALVQAHGAVVPRDELVARCWEGRAIGEDAIQRAIAKARQLAQLSEPAAFAIESIARVGYRLRPGGASSSEAGAAAPPSRAPRPKVLGGRWSVALLAGALALAAAGGGAWLWLGRTPEGPLVAVQAFTAPPGVDGGDLTRRTAQALADRQVIAQTQARPGARPRLAVTGAVERDGADLVVRPRIEDARDGATLWSAEHRRAAAQADGLFDEAALDAADVIARTRDHLGARAASARPELLAAVIKAAELGRRLRAETDLGRAAWLRVLALEPASAGALAAVASADAAEVVLHRLPAELAARYRAESERFAREALRRDPAQPTAFAALHNLLPHTDWTGRLALIDQGLKHAPEAAILASYKAAVLADVGRLRDSAPLALMALTGEPYSPQEAAGVAYRLAQAGRPAEAQAVLDRYQRIMPTLFSLQRARLHFALLHMTPDAALAELDAFQATPHRMEAPVAEVWRRVVQARAGRFDRAAAARDLLAAAGDEPKADISIAVTALSQLGDVDGALALMERARLSAVEFHPNDMFDVSAPALVRDRRFMAAAARYGLVRFWRRTGLWPDFCADPATPYDCRAESAAADR